VLEDGPIVIAGELILPGFQVYVEAPLAETVNVLPAQRLGDEGLSDSVGFGTTVIDNVEVEVQPRLFVPVTK
jgi:hypothetical protein